MEKQLKHKGITSTPEFNSNDQVWFGKLDIDDLVTYEANDKQDLVKEFREAVDDYLKFKSCI